MFDRRGMRHEMDIGAWGRRCSLMRQLCAGTMSLSGPFEMLFVCHIDEIAYLLRSHALFWKYGEKAAEKEVFYWLSLCCVMAPDEKSYLERNAAKWFRELNTERRQRLNVEGHRFVAWNSLEMFAVPPYVRGSSYQTSEKLWVECKSSSTSGIPTTVVFAFLANRAQSRTGSNHNFRQKVAEAEYHVTSLDAFLRCARYVLFERSAYPRMACSCERGGALLYALLEPITL